MPNPITGRIAALEQQLKQVKKGQRLSHGASIEDSAIEVNDSSGSLRAIVGRQGDGTVGVQAVNGPPPPQPSAPVVASVLGGVSAGWDGQFDGGQVLPMDWARTEVHASLAPGFTPLPETLRDTIETAQGATIVVPTDDPVYVRLVARNTSGTASTPSAIVGPVGPSPVVANDILDGIVTTVKLAEDAVTEAKIAAGAVTMNTLGGPLGDTVGLRYTDLFRDATAWAQLSASSGGSFTINTTPAGAPSGGGRLIATGDVQVASTALIPQDSDTLYRVMFRARATAQDPSGVATVYIGVVGVAQDGVTLVNRAGAASNSTQHYCCTAGGSLGTADGWRTYIGWIQGHSATGATAPAGPATDPRAPELMHADVKYLRPMAWLNFGKSTAAVMEIEAVTVEAVRTGVVGSTNLISGSVTAGAIAADAITTGKIAAGAVQTLQLDAAAVNADKLAAGAVTTAKLDALAVTTDKIAANAITADKILAGSITATSLAADAITGKTVTGGLIQTATTGERVTINEGGTNKVIVYDATGVAVGELSPRGMLVKGDSGAVIFVDPDATYPNVRWSNAANTNWASASVAEDTPGAANLEMISGEYTVGTYTDMRSRIVLHETAVLLERLRTTDPAHKRYGGRLWLDNVKFNAGFVNDDDPTKTTNLNVVANAVQTTNGRLSVAAAANQGTALYAEAPSAHTGNLLRLNHGGTDRVTVDAQGNTTITGKLTAGNMATGSVSITPSAANTPTSMTVTYAALAGTTFRGYATANTTVPGVRAPTGNAGVTGVGVSSVTSTSMLVWLNRENTTATTVNWQVIAE
ncbi:hypothetical protein ACFW9D_05625 [Streptomyces sp. NPDC059524]|uniref:hypothetical protein n=1 Tax=Streptomyces sp. NPDC059524 TaxID=3346856 RepID=UPI0036BE67CB